VPERLNLDILSIYTTASMMLVSKTILLKIIQTPRLKNSAELRALFNVNFAVTWQSSIRGIAHQMETRQYREHARYRRWLVNYTTQFLAFYNLLQVHMAPVVGYDWLNVGSGSTICML
jgi:hypothetical protein